MLLPEDIRGGHNEVVLYLKPDMTWIDEDDANFLQVGVAEIFLRS